MLVSRQLSLYEDPEERREAQEAGVSGQPMSGGAILRAEAKRDRSGAQRARVSRDLDHGLLSMYSELVRDHGEEAAVCALFSLLAQAPSYMARAPDWILELCVEYRAELFDTFGQRGGGMVYPSTDIYADEDGTRQ